jgi:TRAP-type C4-dicarboxylate transport system permease small subunit
MGFIRIARSADSKISGISRFLGVMSIIILLAMMLFTVANVVLRAFFSRPIPGDVELIEVAMVCTGFLGMAWCAIKEKHIRVDLLMQYFPGRIKGVVDSIGYIVGLICYTIIAWHSINEGIANKTIGRATASLGIPVYPFYWVTAVGFGALVLAILILLKKSIKAGIGK